MLEAVSSFAIHVQRVHSRLAHPIASPPCSASSWAPCDDDVCCRRRRCLLLAYPRVIAEDLAATRSRRRTPDRPPAPGVKRREQRPPAGGRLR